MTGCMPISFAFILAFALLAVGIALGLLLLRIWNWIAPETGAQP